MEMLNFLSLSNLLISKTIKGGGGVQKRKKKRALEKN